MLIEKLDRTQWPLTQAIDHITIQIEGAIQRGEMVSPPDLSLPPWRQTEVSRATAANHAGREIQIALRDGDLHAKGRLSTTQSRPWSQPPDRWDLHSGHHSTITPEHWRAGNANVGHGVLTMLDGQFIDIRVPRFMVLAIWPMVEPPRPTPAMDPDTGKPYRTPYMDLLDRAIGEFRISQRYQCKKELISDWLRAQEIEGEPLSQNLADAMATLIRLPSSQRGGARRGL